MKHLTQHPCQCSAKHVDDDEENDSDDDDDLDDADDGCSEDGAEGV